VFYFSGLVKSEKVNQMTSEQNASVQLEVLCLKVGGITRIGGSNDYDNKCML